MFNKLKRKLKKRWDSYTPFEKIVSVVNDVSSLLIIVFSTLFGMYPNRLNVAGVGFFAFWSALTTAVQTWKKSKFGTILIGLCALALFVVFLDIIGGLGIF